MSTETIRLIRDGEKVGGGMEVGEEGDYILYLSLHCLGLRRPGPI